MTKRFNPHAIPSGRRRLAPRASAVVAVLLPLMACGGPSSGSLAPLATITITATPAPPQTTLRPAGSVDGADLGYVEYLPMGYGDGTPRPLLVFIHGGGENGLGTEHSLKLVFKLGIPSLIEAGDWPPERPFVVLMPQYPPSEADDCRLADELRAFLDFAIQHYDIDPARVYLTGVSCGAIGVWDYLAREGDGVVAAVVQIAGHLEDVWRLAGCDLGRTPVWVFHGEVDEIVPISYVEDAVDRLEACTDPPPVDVRLTVYPDADHDSWTRTYDLSAGHDIYTWLLGHSKD